MNTTEALKLVGGLSKPSKMPGWAYGIPAAECKTGKKLQDVDHLLKIFEVCKLTPETSHWLPTREAWTADYLEQVPGNLTLRFSMPMIDQPAAGSWVNTSTVVSGEGRTCPAPDQNNECKDCRACWDAAVPNVAYGKH